MRVGSSILQILLRKSNYFGWLPPVPLLQQHCHCAAVVTEFMGIDDYYYNTTTIRLPSRIYSLETCLKISSVFLLLLSNEKFIIFTKLKGAF